MKKLFIFKNNKEASNETYSNFLNILEQREGWEILDEYSDEADFLVCIGGDGTFLSFVHKCHFPKAPILGINTGHLGFFQEAMPENLNETLDKVENGDYTIQKINPIEAKIITEGSEFIRIGINEIFVRGYYSHVSHYSLFIDNTKIEDFSGDGLLISTPVGSTAYNYSLDGSLVSPDLDAFQITPVAPMNTSPYRCFHSSLILPSTKTIRIEGTGRSKNGTMMISFDGRTHDFTNVHRVEINKSNNEINLMRFSEYDYWSKLSSKLL